MENLALLFKVFWAPGEAMFKAAKNKSPLVPLLLISVTSLISVVTTYMYVNMGEMTLLMMEKQRGQSIPAEQRTQMLTTMNSTAVKGFSMVAAAIVPTVVVLLITLLYFGLFTLVGREGGFKAFLTVTAFAFVPSVVRTAAAMLTVIVVPQTQIMLDELGSIGPSILVDRGGMSRKLFTAISQVDVVSLWILALLVIGYRFVLNKRVTALTRTACVFGVWLLYVGIRVAFA
jgi:hypothetical protein